jgi:hypothetical protein
MEATGDPLKMTESLVAGAVLPIQLVPTCHKLLALSDACQVMGTAGSGNVTRNRPRKRAQRICILIRISLYAAEYTY